MASFMVGRMCSRPGGALLGVALSVCLKGNLLPERTVGVETSGITVNRHQAMRPQSQVTDGRPLQLCLSLGSSSLSHLSHCLDANP